MAERAPPSRSRPNRGPWLLAVLLLIAMTAGCAGRTGTGVRVPPPVDEPVPTAPPDH